MVRLTGLLSLVAIAVLSIGAYAAESQTLSLALESPNLAAPSSGASSSTAAASKPKPKADKPKANTVKVGRVGVVQVPTANIYASRSFKSRKYATVKAETPLAITKEEGDWCGVLMTNGLTGWIPSGSVKMTGYELMAKKSDADRAALMSRGDGTSRSGSPGDSIVRLAMSYQQSVSRYVYGGTNPATGMDCSAYVRMVFNNYGIRLPRTAREQAQVGTSVPFDQLQPGDRLYFQCKNSYVDHCGIYAGNGYFIHCSATRNGVGFDSLSSDFFWRSLVAARRS